MKPFLYKALSVAVIGAGVIAGPVAAFAQSAASEGPRPSSVGNWPGITDTTVSPSASYADPTFDGPRASSLGNWTGATGDVYRPYNSVDDPVFEGPRPSSAH